MNFPLFVVNPVLPSPIHLHVSDLTNTTIEVTWYKSSSKVMMSQLTVIERLIQSEEDKVFFSIKKNNFN